MPDISLAGIVARATGEPCVHLKIDGKLIAQLTVTEARSIGSDLMLCASRAEADAMLVRFWKSELGNNDLSEKALYSLLIQFRDFRLGLDLAKPDTSYDPITEEDENAEPPQG